MEPSRNGSLFQSLFDLWTPPDDSLVETAEGIFHEALSPPGLDKRYLAYVQLFVAAIRQSRNLSNIAPRRDVRSSAEFARVDYKHQVLFAKRAQLLGFQSESLEKMCNEHIGQVEDLAAPITEMSSLPIKQRYRRPSGETQKQMQAALFIPNLVQARQTEMKEPTVMFVLQDFVKSFFRPGLVSEWTLRDFEVSLFEPGAFVTTDFRNQTASQNFQHPRSTTLSPSTSDGTTVGRSATTSLVQSPNPSRIETPSTVIRQITASLLHTDMRASLSGLQEIGPAGDFAEGNIPESVAITTENANGSMGMTSNNVTPTVTTDHFNAGSIIHVGEEATENVGIDTHTEHGNHNRRRTEEDNLDNTVDCDTGACLIGNSNPKSQLIMTTNVERESVVTLASTVEETGISETELPTESGSHEGGFHRQLTNSYTARIFSEDRDKSERAKANLEELCTRKVVRAGRSMHPPQSDQVPVRHIEFLEHNGMTTITRSTKDMANHLNKRKGWIVPTTQQSKREELSTGQTAICREF
ncbi:hypothetical protein ACEPPN_006119 [Leptodophora sp. 'Broadleaf-Isolate-01']